MTIASQTEPAPQPIEPAPAPPPPPAPAEPTKESWWSFLKFLLILFVATLVLRSCVVAPFSIPSGSMLPNLVIGDYLFVSKWSYGYSRHSFPFGIASFNGRIPEGMPERGDVVVFRHPTTGDDWVKRVIGLPGDRIQVRDSVLVLNGQPVGRERIADFVVAVSPNSPCQPRGGDTRAITDENGGQACSYPRYRETLPTGRSYEIIDQIEATQERCAGLGAIDPCQADNFTEMTVPDGQVFVMGDNRDDSLDSRFPPVIRDPDGRERDGGVGLLPVENIQGRALISFFSTDGSAQWLLPWTWFTAARWNRFGMTYP